MIDAIGPDRDGRRASMDIKFRPHQEELIAAVGDDTRQFFFLDHPRVPFFQWFETPIWLRPKPRLPACLSWSPTGKLILDPSKMQSATP